jgi:hypothetical protein
MSSFPGADEVVAAYEDQVEALEHLFHARGAVTADPRSRFHGLSDAAIQDRLARDREELDRWAVLMLVASFEATLKTDAEDRIRAKTKDAVRKPLRDLYERKKKLDQPVYLGEILRVWRAHATIGAKVKQKLGMLLEHRHWLAHGRYWTNKYGLVPSPLDARGILDDYLQALQGSVPDFPRP